MLGARIPKLPKVERLCMRMRQPNEFDTIMETKHEHDSSDKDSTSSEPFPNTDSSNPSSDPSMSAMMLHLSTIKPSNIEDFCPSNSSSVFKTRTWTPLDSFTKGSRCLDQSVF